MSAEDHADRQEKIILAVENSWRQVKNLKKLGLADFGVMLFKKIFTENPEVLQLFSFQFEQNIYESDALRHHGNLVIKAIDKAVSHIRNLEEMNPYLEELGKTHADLKRGIKPWHFDLMQRKFIEVLREILEDDFTADIEHAWYVLSVKFFKFVAAGSVIEEINIQANQRKHAHHHHHHQK